MGKREQGSVATVTERPEVAIGTEPNAELQTVVIEVPIMDAAQGGYLDTLALHANTALSNRRKAQEGLRRLHRAIHNAQQMVNGKYVATRSDAIVWLLERIADA